jgi:hypothetical protein
MPKDQLHEPCLATVQFLNGLAIEPPAEEGAEEVRQRRSRVKQYQKVFEMRDGTLRPRS